MSSPAIAQGVARRGNRDWVAPLWFLAPILLVMTFSIGIPLAGLVVSSVIDTGRLSFVNYTSFFGDSYYLRVLLNTASTGVLAALVALLFGYPTALYLKIGAQRARRYIALVLISPMLISVVVRSYALTLLIGPNNPIEKLVDVFIPDAHFNILFTRAGVLVGLVYTLTPFMVLSLVSNMSAIDGRMLAAARSLGAGGWTVFRRIILPLTVPGILSGCFAVFSLSVTSYVLPILLGGSGYTMMAQLISQQILIIYNWPAGYSMSLILLLFNGLLLAVSGILVRRFLAAKGAVAR